MARWAMGRRAIVSILVFGLLWILAAPAAGAAPAEPAAGAASLASWSQFQFGPHHSGFNPYEKQLSPSTVSRLRLDWSATLAPGSPAQAPTEMGGVLFYSNGGALTAASATTGKIKWVQPKAWAIDPPVANGLVYGLSTGKYYDPMYLEAMNASTGQIVWSQSVSSALCCTPDATPMVAGNTVYEGDENGQLYAFNAKTGKPLWMANTYGMDSTPAVYNNLVIAADNGGGVEAFNASTGAQIWHTIADPSGSGFFTSPVINSATGLIYMSGGGGGLVALRISDGSVAWTLPTILGGVPAVANGVIYIAADQLYAISASTGKILWTRSLGAGASATMIANGVVYFQSGDHHLNAVSATSGALLWSHALVGAAYGFGSPIAVNGMVYVASSTLYAFHLV